MNELERFKIIIYEYLSFEDQRLLEAVDVARRNMISFKYHSHYVLQYYEAVSHFENFRKVQLKLYELLRNN